MSCMNVSASDSGGLRCRALAYLQRLLAGLELGGTTHLPWIRSVPSLT